MLFSNIDFGRGKVVFVDFEIDKENRLDAQLEIDIKACITFIEGKL
ncbi:hypothetical protein [Paenilisteria weihenstephanensis]|nr:hypothetical protein [Listeria weihenstephanensis]